MNQVVTSRQAKVQDLLHKEIAMFISSEISDPRLNLITISGVKASRDFSNAKVYFTFFKSNESKKTIEKILNKASGFIRNGLSEKIAMFTVPKLRFYFDDSVEEGNKIESILSQISNIEKVPEEGY